MRFHRLYPIVWLRETLTFVFVKKVKICCLKKLFSVKTVDVWENNFYGNADTECLTDYFCRQCLCYALKAVSYLLYNLFLEEKCN